MLFKTDYQALKSLAQKECNSYWTAEHKNIISSEIKKFQDSPIDLGQDVMLNKIQKLCNEINATLPRISRLEKYKK